MMQQLLTLSKRAETQNIAIRGQGNTGPGRTKSRHYSRGECPRLEREGLTFVASVVEVTIVWCMATIQMSTE
eukprot:2769032-Amphidinium_carterae.1